MTNEQLEIIDDACMQAISIAASNDRDDVGIELVIAQLSRGDLKEITEAIMDDWIRDQIRIRARAYGLTLTE